MNKKEEEMLGSAIDFISFFSTHGWGKEDIKKLFDPRILKKLLSVVRNNGEVEIVPIDMAVNCDAELTSIPSSWSVHKHRSLGLLKFDLSKILLFQTKDQKNGRAISGCTLEREVKNFAGNKYHILNANFQEYLLGKKELILKSRRFRNKQIHFFGTIFKRDLGPTSDYVVKSLDLRNDRLHAIDSYYWLERMNFGPDDYVALVKI